MKTALQAMGPPRHGHAHFWQRALTRSQFVRTAAAATGAIVTADLWTPSLAQAAGPSVHPSIAALGAAAPKEIPGFFVPFPGAEQVHLFLPGTPNDEPSSITDFNGQVGLAHVSGTGTDGTGTSLTFDADMRFMRGLYIGTDGQRHIGTFGLV